MTIKIDAPVIAYEDNQSAIAIATNEVHHSRAKYIDIRYHHFIQDQIKAKVIQLEYIETQLQFADFLTKAISTKKFQVLVTKSNIKDLSSRDSVEVAVPSSVYVENGVQ